VGDVRGGLVVHGLALKRCADCACGCKADTLSACSRNQWAESFKPEGLVVICSGRVDFA
jgi:hypothetical protein